MRRDQCIGTGTTRSTAHAAKVAWCRATSRPANAATNGDRPPTAGGMDGTSPLTSSVRVMAQAGSNCSMTSAARVMTVKPPTSTIAKRSITP